MRIWLSGPRMLGGLIRPGVSFAVPAAAARSAEAPPTPKLDKAESFAIALVEIAVALFLFVAALAIVGIVAALIP